MSPKPVYILDSDASVTKQTELVSRYRPEVTDLRDLAPAARFWMDERTRRAVAARLPEIPDAGIVFLGSGDFHHYTSILTERITEPFTLISFDTHPDWDICSPWLSCGSWVSRMLARPNLAKAVLLGASRCDVSPFAVLTGHLGALAGDRVEIYPYQCRPVRVPFRRVPDNISIMVDRRPFFSTIRWNELARKNTLEFFMHVVRRLPTRKVYVTVDKDCLESDYALTNWGEGGLSLDDLLTMLKEIRDNREIIGIDINGDYSPVRATGIVKKAALYLNQPRNVKALAYSEAFVTNVNEQTNLRLLELLAGG